MIGGLLALESLLGLPLKPLVAALPLLVAAQVDPGSPARIQPGRGITGKHHPGGRPSLADEAMDRLVSGLSRDALVVFFIPDSASMMRRIRRVPSVDVVGRLTSEDLRGRASESASQLSLFVPPVVIAAAPALLQRIQGGVALSVEGFVFDRGVARPDVLLVADEAGIEDVVPALIALARGDAGAAETIRAVDLPFKIGARRPRVGVSRGVLIVELVTDQGVQLALAANDGRVLAARSAERVATALSRIESGGSGGSRGDASILGSDRFQEAMSQVRPMPGDVIWYADLRRLRHEEAFVMAPPGVIRNLFVDHLGDMDGLAVAIRGVGEAFHGRAFLERGRWASRGDGPGIAGLFTRESPFRFPSDVSSPVSAAVAFHVDPLLSAHMAGQIADTLLQRGSVSDSLDRILEPHGGDAYLHALSRHIGNEVVIFQPEGAFPGESLPRLGLAVRVRNEEAVTAWFERLVTGGSVRGIDLRGHRAWVVRLSDIPVFAPVFALEGGWLVGANHIFALRRILLRANTAPKLAADDGFHDPFDRLDLSLDGAGLVAGYIDSSRVAESFATWLGGGSAIAWMSDLDDDDWEMMHEIRELVDDPEFQDSLRGMALHLREVPSGFLLEIVGP